MKIIKNELNNKLNIRTEKDFPIKGVEFIDITSLFFQHIRYKKNLHPFILHDLNPFRLPERHGPGSGYNLYSSGHCFIIGDPDNGGLEVPCLVIRTKKQGSRAAFDSVDIVFIHIKPLEISCRCRNT